MNKKRLITSALPYVNNIPHLGNIIQVLSADVFARFCRSRGYETLYICGTDEYGTATETKARGENITPQALCDKYYEIHKDIYQWFHISFDTFGRTSTPQQTKIVQDIFKQLETAGYIEQKETRQLYSETSEMFLPDRYVQGTCPKCGYDFARGDQCEHCGALLDPLDLKNPISTVDKTIPIIKKTKHLYINLPKLLPKIKQWVDIAKQKGTWSKNAIKMTEAWIRDGLHERAITRDLKWGIEVPYEGFEDKVFYVWFDAPIGYISMTKCLTDDWEVWWKNPDEVALYQFVGKDNIPFHTVIFPASLLGTGESWTMLHQISSSEYFNYEGGMFSKSKGVGVFGNDVQETNIPADVWRFYMMYNRPETSDYLFTWKDFGEAVNGELINNLSNLYNRTFSFISKNFDGAVLPISLHDEQTKLIWESVIQFETEITALLEKVELRQAYLKIFALSSYANKLMQDYEPWKLIKEDSKKTHWLLSNLVYIIREIIVLMEPYTPQLSGQVADILQCPLPQWTDLVFLNPNTNELHALTKIQRPSILLKRLENDVIQEFREKFSGNQDTRKAKESENISSLFADTVHLKVCKIQAVEDHSNADTLYVLRLDDGSDEGRTIVSGIKNNYTKEALLEKHIIVVANLKPAKLRGEMSNGMLLAASKEIEGEEIVDVLFVAEAAVGDSIIPQGTSPNKEYKTIKADKFFNFTIHTDEHYSVNVDGHPLVVNGKESVCIKSTLVNDASVG